MGLADFNRKTTAAKAVEAAGSYARKIKALPSCYFGPDDGACPPGKRATHDPLWEVWIVADQLAPQQRNAFLYELGQQMGGTRAFWIVERGTMDEDVRQSFGSNEIQIKSAATLTVLDWVPEPNTRWVGHDQYDGSVYPTTPPSPSDLPVPGRSKFEAYDKVKPKSGTIIVPVTTYMVREGETYTFSFAVMHETGRAEGREGSVEVYITAEAGAKLSMSFPVISFSFDVKTGIKRAEKVYDREEKRSAVRASMQVSKSYLLETIARSVRVYGPRGSYYNVEVGYRIERKEGGPPLGPFWPDYNVDGHTANGRDSAFSKAYAHIKKLLEEAAGTLARWMLQL